LALIHWRAQGLSIEDPAETELLPTIKKPGF
jgi:hypothetical protein